MKAVTVAPGTAGSVQLEEVPVRLRRWVGPGRNAGCRNRRHRRRVRERRLRVGASRPSPADLGDEPLGRAVDPGPSGFTVGEHVVGMLRRPDPLPCPNCAVGESDMCSDGRYTERGIKQVDGFMAERWRIEPDYAVRMDKSLGTLGVLLEPATVVAKAWEHILAIGRRTFWDPHHGPRGRCGADRTAGSPQSGASWVRTSTFSIGQRAARSRL